MRLAPRARRRAISPRLETPRASTSPATFAQTISSEQSAHRAQHDHRWQHVGLCTKGRLPDRDDLQLLSDCVDRRGRLATALTERPFAPTPRHASCPAGGDPARSGNQPVGRTGPCAGRDPAPARSDVRDHHDRDEHFDVEADDSAVERWGRDADHGHRIGIEPNGLADDVGVAAEVTRRLGMLRTTTGC